MDCIYFETPSILFKFLNSGINHTKIKHYFLNSLMHSFLVSYSSLLSHVSLGIRNIHKKFFNISWGKLQSYSYIRIVKIIDMEIPIHAFFLVTNVKVNNVAGSHSAACTFQVYIYIYGNKYMHWKLTYLRVYLYIYIYIYIYLNICIHNCI